MRCMPLTHVQGQRRGEAAGGGGREGTLPPIRERTQKRCFRACFQKQRANGCSIAPQCVPRAAPRAALPDRRARASPRNGIYAARAPCPCVPASLRPRRAAARGGHRKRRAPVQLLILRAAAPPSRRAAPAAGLCPGATCRSSCRYRRRVGAWPSRESSPRTRWRPSATTRCVCVPGGGVALSDTTYVASPRRVARPRMCYKHH